MEENIQGTVSVEGTGAEGTAETAKTYNEAEVMELIQKTADKRVTDALKKQEYKFNQKMAEAEKLKNMDEEQRKSYEFEQKLNEFEAQKKEFALMQNKLEASKVLSNRGLPMAFVDYIVAEDADTMMENINIFEKSFKAAVNDAVSSRIASPSPKSATVSQQGMTREQFSSLSISQLTELERTNPTLFAQFSN